jgi:hypothetical protein
VYWMLKLRRSNGPLLRRGTTRLDSGTGPRSEPGTGVPGACTARSSGVPFSRLLTRNSSGISTTGSRRPWWTVLIPLGEAVSFTTCSR